MRRTAPLLQLGDQQPIAGEVRNFAHVTNNFCKVGNHFKFATRTNFWIAKDKC